MSPDAPRAAKAANLLAQQFPEIAMNQALLARHSRVGRIARPLLSRHHTPTIRKRSRTRIAGLPLFEIAFGPQPARGEPHGHAKALIAIGDQATGVLAIGGLAQGVVAVGGLSEGLIAVGGCTLGLSALSQSAVWLWAR
jgi:hypothetical protein